MVATSIFSEDVVQTAYNQENITIQEGFEFFIDSNFHKDFKEIHQDSKLPFQKYKDFTFQFGKPNSNIWLRFRLPSVVNSSLYSLVFNYPFLNVMEVYIPISKSENSNQYLIYSRSARNNNYDWLYRYPIFDLPENYLTNEYTYVCIHSIYTSANFSVSINSNKFINRRTWIEMLILGIAAGTLFSMLLYNFSIFIFLKDYSYLFYFLYIISMLTFQVMRSKILDSLGILLPEATVYWFGLFSLWFGILFGVSFLKTREFLPGIHNLFRFCLFIVGITFLLFFFQKYAIATRMIYFNSIFATFLLVYSCVWRIRQKYSPAKYFLSAWIVLTLSTLMVAFTDFGIFLPSFFTHNILFWGASLESILLSMALANNLKTIREERDFHYLKEMEFSKLSITDELTGLLNKRGYFMYYENLINYSKNGNSSLSFLILDLDNFKRINDTYGHDIGDKILINLGKTLNSFIRHNDIACRFGGEEFVVLLPDCGLESALVIAERIRSNFESIRMNMGNGYCISSTVSIGITEFQEEDNEVSLFQRADSALYKAKSEGRNRIMIG